MGGRVPVGVPGGAWTSSQSRRGDLSVCHRGKVTQQLGFVQGPLPRALGSDAAGEGPPTAPLWRKSARSQTWPCQALRDRHLIVRHVPPPTRCHSSWDSHPRRSGAAAEAGRGATPGASLWHFRWGTPAGFGHEAQTTLPGRPELASRFPGAACPAPGVAFRQGPGVTQEAGLPSGHSAAGLPAARTASLGTC